MSRPKPRVSDRSRRTVALVFGSIFASTALVAALLAYFTWCPRFGHAGQTDEEQVAVLAMADSGRQDAANVYADQGYALVAWSVSSDQQRPEELFERRFCHWRLAAKSQTGLDLNALFALGVPSHVVNHLYARLMEGYAEGP